jgi:hypothetical protein
VIPALRSELSTLRQQEIRRAVERSVVRSPSHIPFVGRLSAAVARALHRIASRLERAADRPREQERAPLRQP